MELPLPTPTELSLSERLSITLARLRQAVADIQRRDPWLQPVIMLLWPYLNRLAQRFESLLARYQAGRLTARRPRPATAKPALSKPATAGDAPARPPKPATRLPRRYAWLIGLIPEARPYGGPLVHLMRDPEMAAFLAAVPQAARLLRPLCRMFAIGPPDPELPAALFPLPKPRPDRPAAKPKGRTPRAPKPARKRGRRGLPTHPSGRVPSANWGKGV